MKSAESLEYDQPADGSHNDGIQIVVPLSTDARVIDNGVVVYAKLLAGNFKPLLDSFNLSWWLVVVIGWGG